MTFEARLFGAGLPDTEEIESRFPPRTATGYVTRFAPSPTGFLHLGGIYAALISRYVARQSQGVFFLRIEDTDKAREVPDAVRLLATTLQQFNITWSEGPDLGGGESGRYGPYHQSARREIYWSYARALMRRGLAYPCFATSLELDALANEQRQLGLNPGYYGEWAPWRKKSAAAVEAALDNGLPWVLRFKSEGSPDDRVSYDDLIKGPIELPQNHHDAVILKSDGLPTYHFAHAVDDHLMRTTHVIRGDEWISSVPLHLALFAALGVEPPAYAHIAPLEVLDGSSRRKLSKRKDPEADARHYLSRGYPVDAVKSYLLTIANSQFELWRKDHKSSDLDDFPFDLNALGASGALLDFEKLDSISRGYFVECPLDVLVGEGIRWAAEYDPELHRLWSADMPYLNQVLATQRVNPARPRKDLAKWIDFRPALGFFYESLFDRGELESQELQTLLGNPQVSAAVGQLCDGLGSATDSATFTQLLRGAADANGLVTGRPVPGDAALHISALYTALKLALCGRHESMDLWVLIGALGRERAIARIAAAAGMGR